MSRSNTPPDNLPEGWSPKQLSDIARVFGGGRLKLNKSNYLPDGATAYSAAGPDGYVEIAESDEPSIILSAIGARCGKSFLTDGPWTSLANTQVIVPHKNIADARFLHSILNDESYWNRSGSAQPFIKPSDVKGAWVAVPPLDEQHRIAEVLQAIDEAVQTASAAIDQANIAHVGLLGFLMAGGDDIAWPEFKLGELVADPITYGVVQPGEYLDDGVLLVRGGDFPHGQIEIENLPRIAPAVASPYQRSMLRGGEILVSLVGYPGACALVPETLAGANISRSAALVRPARTIDGAFLYHFIRSPVGQKRILLNSIGSAQQVVNLKDLRDVVIPLPTRERQEEIASILNLSAENVLLAKQNLTRLKTLKSSIATDLLSGRVRVPE